MGEDLSLEITLIEINCIICGLGIFCLLLVIPIFLLSKRLRSHPGSIILASCICELMLYYFVLVAYIDALNYTSIYEFCADSLNAFTYEYTHISPQSLIHFSVLTIGTLLQILYFYYFFLSLDLILLIRNPFYSPIKRLRIYHASSLIIPIFIIMPYNYCNTLLYILYMIKSQGEINV